MSNLATLLKQEIVRLARREMRGSLLAARKTAIAQRHEIAGLKREVGTLKREVGTLRRLAPAKPTVAPVAAGNKKLRFVRKGLQAQRKRLGLSAEGYGKLAGVSDQTVHNWELGHTVPSPQHLAVIAAIRSLSKREAMARLEQMHRKAPAAKNGNGAKRPKAAKNGNGAHKVPRKGSRKGAATQRAAH